MSELLFIVFTSMQNSDYKEYLHMENKNNGYDINPH